MKLLHLADLHKSRERFAEVEASLNVAEETARREAVDLILLAGDLYDGAEQNSELGLHDPFAARIQRLGDIAPVAIVYGTPTHDIPGSLDILARLSCRFGITILQPGQAYFLDSLAGVTTRDEGQPRALLFGVPEPSKKWLLANGGATGKDEAAEAMRSAMRALLLGLGATRREHPELPCVMMYHGQVRGCKLSNGTTLSDGPVSADDLRSVGADYYALGDIHEPQQIPGVPAYYPGSIYPIDWGETHKAGCNLVELSSEALLGEFPARVTRIDFTHPQRIKLSGWPGDHIAYLAQDAGGIRGKLVWVEITATTEEAASIDTAAISEALATLGALAEPRIEIRRIPTETVRAGEIAEKKTLREKVIVYGENSSTPMPETVLVKADEIEADAARRDGHASGAHIRVTRLRLRGAKGTWKNSKADEIDLDLDALGPGVIALVGENGSGKTTLVENLHAWANLLTRDGTLKDHFRLRDSCRELWFTDERTGDRYRALITINAATASGSTEYYLFRETATGEEPYGGTNGRKEVYEAAIAELWGSLEMFLRTAFNSQRPSKFAPELQDATKGERKALIAELSGIDYLDGYRQTCKARADGIDAELVSLNAAVTAAADVDEIITRVAGEIETADGQAVAAAIAADQAIERGLALKVERDRLAERVAEIDRKAQRRTQIEREIADLLTAATAAKGEIEGFRAAADGRGAAEAELARIKALEEERDGLKAEKTGVDQANHAVLEQYQAAYAVADGSARTLRDELARREKAAANADQKLAVARARLSAPIADTCPTCGQTLPADRIEAMRQARERDERRIAELEREQKSARSVVATTQTMLDAILYPAKPEPKTFAGAAHIAALEADLAFADADGAWETIRRADEAAVRIEEGGKRLQEMDARRLLLAAEAAVMAPKPEDEQTRSELAQKEAQLAAERGNLTVARTQEAAAKATADAGRRSLDDARKRRDARERARAEMAGKKGELDDWRILERATGPDGIQALELDALAPSIAAVANRLLAEAYGSQFAVEFRTTRISSGSVKRAKQIEDFLIYIIDSETGEEQEIATLSGGESVWIKRAIYDAFATIRAQNTGTKFLVAIQDEVDGALDPAARMRYLRMLEAAHNASGRYQTILITHSTELQAMIGTTVRMSELAGGK